MLRYEHRVNQEYVAQRAGASTFTYQKFRMGESGPDISDRMIAEGCGG